MYRKTTEDEYYGEISVETARLWNECAGTKIHIKKKEETVMLCKAWADQEAKGIAKGEARERCSTIRNACKIMSVSDIVKIFKYEESFVKKVISLMEEYPEATDKELVEKL